MSGAPTGTLIDFISECCRELLDIDEIGPDDMLLALGGNSMLAPILANRIEEEIGTRPCLEDILLCTIAELADQCENRGK